jgi:hypothetical protein
MIGATRWVAHFVGVQKFVFASINLKVKFDKLMHSN